MGAEAIVFLVIGLVVIVVDICRYVKQKFFHKVEEHHEEGMTINADELTMDGKDLLKLTHWNREVEFAQVSEFGGNNQNGTMYGKNVKITFKNNSSSVDHLRASHQERGDSKIAEQIVGNILPSMISPHSEISNAVIGVIKENFSKIKWKNPFSKRDDKKQQDNDDIGNHDKSEMYMARDDYTEMHMEPTRLCVKAIPKVTWNEDVGKSTIDRVASSKVSFDLPEEHAGASASSECDSVSTPRYNDNSMLPFSSSCSSPISQSEYNPHNMHNNTSHNYETLSYSVSPSYSHQALGSVKNPNIHDSGSVSCDVSLHSSPVWERKSSISAPSLLHSKLYNDYGTHGMVSGGNNGASTSHQEGKSSQHCRKFYEDPDIMASESTLGSKVELYGDDRYIVETAV